MENIITNTTNSTEETGIKIKLKNPIDFAPVGDIKITTTTEMSKVINDIFSQTFADYYGSSLKVQFQPELKAYIVIPCLFFRVQKNYDENKRYAFHTLGSSSPNESMINRIQRVSQSIATGAQVEITPAGKSALFDFVISSVAKSSNFDWKSAFRTITSEGETYIQVFKFDILKFITMIYGEVDTNNSKQYYQVIPLNVVGTPNQYKAADNWSLNIIRLNHANEAYAAELLGFNIPSQSAMPTVVTELSGR